MIHLYFGDGKGKTSAAAGVCLRSIFAQKNVIFVQFLKSRVSGETKMLETLGAKIFRGKQSPKFFREMSEEEKRETRKMCCSIFESAADFSNSLLKNAQDSFENLIVFDEICAAFEHDLIEKNAFLHFLDSAKNTEIVLTGRNPPPVFFEKADYITEFKKMRHPFDLGISARQGIEF